MGRLPFGGDTAAGLRTLGRASLARRSYWAGFPSSLELSADSPVVPNYRCGAVPGCAPESLLGLPVGVGTAGEHKILCPNDRRQLVYTPRRFGCEVKGTRFEFAAAPATVTGERSSDTPLRFPTSGRRTKATTREPGDLPRTVVQFPAGVCRELRVNRRGDMQQL